jgi:hypothetical protein
MKGKTHIQTSFGSLYCGKKRGIFWDYFFPQRISYKQRLKEKQICKTCRRSFLKFLNSIRRK